MVCVNSRAPNPTEHCIGLGQAPAEPPECSRALVQLAAGARLNAAPGLTIVIQMANYLAGTAKTASDLDPVFLALGDPTRRGILQRLVLGRATVSELAAPFSMALPSLLKHLGVLERSGLIRTEKRGRVRSCVLQADRLRLAEGWLAEQRQLWEARSDRMAAHVDQMMAAETACSMAPEEQPDEPQR